MANFQVTSINHFGAIAAGLQPTASLVIRVALVNIQGRATGSMEGKSSPSAPGTPPAIRSGVLHGSVFTRMISPLLGMVGTNTEYAPHLEFGTIHMAPRPWLGPAVNAERGPFLEAMAGMFKK